MAADFTMLLRDVVDVTGGDWGVETYPIFDEAYRKQLNQTLYEIYCYREIGFETIDIFRQQVAAKMRLVMPYYNQLYESAKLQYDPLSAVDMTTWTDANQSGSGNQKSTSSSESTSSGESTSAGREHAYPGSPIYKEGDYATTGTTSEGRTAGKNGQKATSDASHSDMAESHARSGQRGRMTSGAALVTEYRQAMINVDQMVVAELEPLFMGIASSGDAHVGSDATYPFGLWYPWWGR